MSSSRQRIRWLLLIHQLPAEPAYLRVKVGRRLLRVGAVALKNSVYLLPALDACREDFSWIRREIVDEGGDACVFEAATVEGLTNGDIERMFGEARKKENDELTREVATLPCAGTVEKPHERQAALSARAARRAAQCARAHRLLPIRKCRDGTRQTCGGSRCARAARGSAW